MLLKWLNKNIDYGKKWWAEGNRKVREIEVTKEEFEEVRLCFAENYHTEPGKNDIDVAELYLGERALKYIIITDKVRIGYYEGEPERSITELKYVDGGIV